MSYNLIPQIKKSRSFSKYLYSSIDLSDDFYIFDIKLTNPKKKLKKFKKIKNSKSDVLINNNDEISFTKYSKLEINITSLNNKLDSIDIEIELTNEPIIYQDDKIYLEITSDMDLMNCFYNLEIYN